MNADCGLRTADLTEREGHSAFRPFSNPQSAIRNPNFLQPAHHRDARAAAGLGLDLEEVDEPLRAREPLAEAAPRREAVAHGGGDVRDAGAAVLEDEPEPGAPLRGVERLRDHAAAARVLDDVARQLRRDRGEPRLVDEAEADPGGYRAHLAA